ncbi:hypothetical protein GASC598I20_003450, partial [Gilliamella apicola SCGC AB-598-I20]
MYFSKIQIIQEAIISVMNNFLEFE